MMDWYFGHEVGDLVVPKEHEYFDRLPSPDSWSQWGNCGYGNIGWPNNFDSEKISNLPDEKPDQNMSFGRANNEISQTEGECSFGSNSRSSEDSRRRNSASGVRHDCQFDNLMETDAMDDIFMSSLLQDDFPAAAGHNHSSISLTSQSENTMMQADSNSTDMMMDFQSISSETEAIGNFRNAHFCQSANSENGNVSFSDPGWGNSSGQSNSSSVKVLETMGMLPSDSRRCGDEDSLVEESVLMGLESVVKQMSDNTRLCFRDSLYRLAQRSKQQLSVDSQVEGLPFERSTKSETGDVQTRSARPGSTESKTNSIDRAVASLMFNKVNPNIHDHPAMSAKFEHQGNPLGARCNHGSSQGEPFSLTRPIRLPADSEVPVFRQQHSHNPSSLPSCANDSLL